MPKNIGPWSVEDFESFVRLGERIVAPPPIGSVAQRFGPYGPKFPRFKTLLTSGDYETIEEAWDARRRHPIHEWLVSNQDFRAAWETFQKHRRRKPSEKLRTPIAELVFLRLVVECVGWCFVSKQNSKRPRGATAPRRRSAVHHASELLKLFEDGVRLSDYKQHGQLETLLQKLDAELRSSRRKEYEGARITGTRALQIFALHLVMEFDLRSPSIVHDVANMAGLSRERTTCERYVKAAAEYWQAALSRALEERQKSAST